MRIHIYTILASLLFTASVINAQTTNCLQNNFCSYDLSDSVQAPFSSVGTERTIILRQRQERSKSNTQKKAYQIDTNYLFLAGNSAGSITVLNVAFDSAQALLNAINPNQGTATISQALGPIDADYYVGGTDVLYHSLIKGVLAQWGSLALPNGYTAATAKNFFDYKVPVILFHGKQDPIVPIGHLNINFAPVDNGPGSQTNYGNTYNLETSCLATTSFKAAGETKIKNPDVFTYGSDSIFYNILQPLNIPSELHVDLQMRHGLDTDGPAFKSDFGIGTTLGTNTDYSTAAAVSLYIISRACIFFQNIIGGNAQARQNSSTTHKVFIECENNRVKCDLLNNDPGCGIAP